MGARRFLFVTGKGGVGKTTVTAALALALAAQGKRVLVAMCGAHERLSSILGTPPIGHDLQLLSERVWATKVDPDRAMEEYGELVIKVRAVAGMVFDNKYTQGFFRAVPGLHDWAMLGKAWYHSTETRDDGSPRFDIVLFDAPSTGHGLDMLRVPKVILDIVPPGVLRRDAEAAWAMFRDPVRSGVVVVSLPEDMPTTETLELLGALDEELRLPVATLIVNQVLEPLFDASERQALLTQSEWLEPERLAPDMAAVDATLAAAVHRAARESLQARNLERVRQGSGLVPVTLPYLLEGGGTVDSARILAEQLRAAVGGIDPSNDAVGERGDAAG
jgi:anion-transporting  ArsA/GET3 family ATPase